MLKLLLLLLASLSPSAAFSSQAASSDIEMWNEVDISAKLTERATLTVPFVIRDSFTLPDPQLGGFGPVLDFELEKHVTVTAGYLYVRLPHTGPGFTANVPLAAVTLRQALGAFRLQDRNRAEGLIGIPNNPIRYRNKLILDLSSPNARWLPFISDEVFYDFSQSRWTQNRFQVGIGRQLSNQLRLDGFYLERSVHKTDPTATHALGVTLEVRLTPGTRRKGVSHEEN